MSTYFPLLFAWLLFGAIHSALATTSVKKIAAKILGRRFNYYRLIYSLIATATLLWVLHVHFSFDEPVLWVAPWYQSVIAWVGLLAGLAIMLVCIRKYFLYLSGIDVFLEQKPVATLEQTSMHAYVRHPLYSGTLLFVWSIFVGYPYMNNLISCVAMTVYTLIGIYFEEKKLVKEYGAAYNAYRANVPALIPKL